MTQAQLAEKAGLQRTHISRIEAGKYAVTLETIQAIAEALPLMLELAEVEKKIAEYDARFANATEYNADDYKAYDELKSRYDHLMHEWEKASYEVEITENQ